MSFLRVSISSSTSERAVAMRDCSSFSGNATNVFEKAGKLVSKLHMKAGRINSLKAGSIVKLFEEIYNSRSISFEGLEIIARADSRDNTIRFKDLAKETFEIRATEEMKEKCTKDGVLDYEKLKMLLMQKRVEFVKQSKVCDELSR